jgi:D-arabinose 1-dehydrogenase-like Zn-dependent alcohol dehydrogenase
MKLVEKGKIQPVIYSEGYHGLEAVPRALDDAKERRAWGRAVLRIDEDAEQSLEVSKPRL